METSPSRQPADPESVKPPRFSAVEELSGPSSEAKETRPPHVDRSGPILIPSLQRGIDVGDVVINGTHALFPFEIENAAALDCCVRFESSLGHEITFQFENENINEFDSPEDYNELFNLVERSNEMQLEAFSKGRVTLQFKPDPSRISALTHGQQQSREGEEETRSRHHFIEIQGAVLVSVLKPDYKYEIPFHARICRSELRVDVEDILFEECHTGGSFVRDFTVWNASQIPLNFSIVLPAYDQSSYTLSFKNFETGLSMTRAIVPAYSPMKIRVTFQPKRSGEQLIPVHIMNNNDEKNTCVCRIFSHVLESIHKGVLGLNCESLDFGDCYTDMPYHQIIKVQNLSREAIDLNFISNRPDEVHFS